MTKTIQQAIEAHQQGRFEEAEQIYCEILKIETNHLDANNNMGAILYKLDRLKEAEIYYKKTIKIKPDFAAGHYNLAIILQKLARFDEAEKSYKKAIEFKPDFFKAHSNLGNVLRRLGKLEEAEINYKKSINLTPDFITIKSIIYKGDWELSKELLEKMCIKNLFDTEKIVNESIYHWCVYCRKLLNLGDIKKFIKILSKLILIRERNQDLNDLKIFFFENVDINKIFELVELNDKILIKLVYNQYKFLTEDYLSSEKLATANIQDTKNLIKNIKTEDLGWLIVRRSLALYKNKNIARKDLNNLLSNLEVDR